MTPRDAIKLSPGFVLAVPDLWTGELLRIEQFSHMSFRLHFDEQDPEMAVDVDLRQADFEVSPGSDPGLDSVQLRPFDVVTVPALGPKILFGITEIRPGRFQLQLEEKFQERSILDGVAVEAQHKPFSMMS